MEGENIETTVTDYYAGRLLVDPQEFVNKRSEMKALVGLYVYRITKENEKNS